MLAKGNGRRRAGEKNHQILEHGGGALIDELLGFGVSIPGLGDVTVGGDQAVADKKSCAGNARANDRTLIRESDLIDAVNVADGIAIAVQDDGGHGLVLLELLDLRGQFMNLILRGRWGRSAECRGGRVVVDHGEGSQEQHDSQDGLHHLLPAIADDAGRLRLAWASSSRGLVDLGFGHECRERPRNHSKSFCFQPVRALHAGYRRTWSSLSSSVWRRDLLRY